RIGFEPDTGRQFPAGNDRQGIGDGGIVGGGARKHLLGQAPARGQADGSGGLNLLGNDAIVGGIGHHGDRLVVFGSRAQHGGSANIDVFDQLAEFNPARGGAGGGSFERIQIDHYNFDGTNTLGFHLAAVLGLRPASQEAPMHARMQGLDPAVQHFGKTGELGHVAHGQPGFAESSSSAAGRQQLKTQGAQTAGKFGEPGLVADREDGAARGGWGGRRWHTSTIPAAQLGSGGRKWAASK